MFATIAADAGVRDADATAGQLLILRDGAMVNGYLSDPDTISQRLQLAYRAIIAAGNQQVG